MFTKDFDYYLPKSLIAQKPIKPRDASRLLIYCRERNKINHDYFYNLGKYLKKGDVIVLNNSKVIPARLIGRCDGSGRKIEVLLLRQIKAGVWSCLLGGKRGMDIIKIKFPGSRLEAEIIGKNKEGTWRVRFNLKRNSFWREVSKIGEVPTPPYIKSHTKFDAAEKDFYQTIFASKQGSVAAPTAGFHFTQKLVKNLKGRGVKFAFITLHVGLGTFALIKKRRIEEHQMQAEWFELNKYTADILNKAKVEGRRIIAVGTTVTRVLENCVTTPLPRRKKFLLLPHSGQTEIFIYPEYKFKFIDGLITNFHLPCSTPLLLVAAFIGERSERNKILFQIYNEAIKKRYRFYSFGDAMLIL